MIVGWVLIVLGVVAIAAGVGGGIATMFKEIQKRANEGAADLPGLPSGLIDSLVKFLEALTKAPVWLALVIIGLLLVAWGGTMI
jgi:hypothetical protein